jgi:hypothetical protein
VVAQSAENKMAASNLAIVFAPTLIRDPSGIADSIQHMATMVRLSCVPSPDHRD